MAHKNCMRVRIADPKTNSPLEADETIVAVVVFVAISFTAFIIIFVIADEVKRLEDPSEQRTGPGRTNMEEGPGIDVFVRNSSTFGVETALSLRLVVIEATEGRSLGGRNDGREEGEKGEPHFPKFPGNNHDSNKDLTDDDYDQNGSAAAENERLRMIEQSESHKGSQENLATSNLQKTGRRAVQRIDDLFDCLTFFEVWPSSGTVTNDGFSPLQLASLIDLHHPDTRDSKPLPGRAPPL